jgi:uncharacterized protein YqgV (UPF0045/DUF77 family)
MDGLSVTVSVVAIVATVAGWVGVVVRGTKVRTTLDTDTKNDITNLKNDVANIKKAINNGGLKDAVNEMQKNCAGEMTKVIVLVEEHIKLPSHPGVTEIIARIDERVKNLEEERRKNG